MTSSSSRRVALPSPVLSATSTMSWTGAKRRATNSPSLSLSIHSFAHDNTIESLLQSCRLHQGVMRRWNTVPLKMRVNCSTHSMVLRMQRPTLLPRRFWVRDEQFLVDVGTPFPTIENNCAVVLTNHELVDYEAMFFGVEGREEEQQQVVWMQWHSKLILLLYWLYTAPRTTTWRAPSSESGVLDHSVALFLPISLMPLLEVLPSHTLAPIDKPREGACVSDWIDTWGLRANRFSSPVQSMSLMTMEQFHLLLYVFAALQLDTSSRQMYCPGTFLGAMKLMVRGLLEPYDECAAVFAPAGMPPGDISQIAVYQRDRWVEWERITLKLLQLKRFLTAGDEKHKLPRELTEAMWIMTQCPAQVDFTSWLLLNKFLPSTAQITELPLGAIVSQLVQHMDFTTITDARTFVQEYEPTSLRDQLCCFVIPGVLATSVNAFLNGMIVPRFTSDIQYSLFAKSVEMCTLLIAPRQLFWNAVMKRTFAMIYQGYIPVQPYFLPVALVSMLAGNEVRYTVASTMNLLYEIMGLPLPPVDCPRIVALCNLMDLNCSRSDAWLALFAHAPKFAVAVEHIQLLNEKFQLHLPQNSNNNSNKAKDPPFIFIQTVASGQTLQELITDQYNLLTQSETEQCFGILMDPLRFSAEDRRMISRSIVPVLEYSSSRFKYMQEMTIGSTGMMTKHDFERVSFVPSQRTSLMPCGNNAMDPVKMVLCRVIMAAFAGGASLEMQIQSNRVPQYTLAHVEQGAHLELLPLVHCHTACHPLLVSLIANPKAATKTSLLGLLQTFQSVLHKNGASERKETNKRVSSPSCMVVSPSPTASSSLSKPNTAIPKARTFDLQLDLPCDSDSSSDGEN